MMYQMATQGRMVEVSAAAVAQMVSAVVAKNAGAKQHWSKGDAEVEVTLREGGAVKHLLYAVRLH